MKTVQIDNVYTLQAVLDAASLFAESCYHVRIGRYGFAHDVGTRVTFVPCEGNETPTGWSTLEHDFSEMCSFVRRLWDIYH